MSVNFDSFLRWAEDRFGDVLIKGEEIRLHSIFADDKKHHLWCNPHGGKYRREFGCFHCFKSDRKGTLVGLVMLVDNCSFIEALNILDGNEVSIRIIEQDLDAYFADEPIIKNTTNHLIELPQDTYAISELRGTHKEIAETYLNGRKMPLDKFLYCISGRYRNRIIIPYYNENNQLIYFNGRIAVESDDDKYRFPVDNDIGKGDVLYVPKWMPSKKIYLTEGEFDSMAIHVSGFFSGACGGKSTTDNQINILRPYNICLAFDNDYAGIEEGLKKEAPKLAKKGFKVSYVVPPVGFKDWNKLLEKTDKVTVRDYISKNERVYDPFMDFLI